MCNQCPHRQAGYCGCFDTFLNENNGNYEPLYECLNPEDTGE